MSQAVRSEFCSIDQLSLCLPDHSSPSLNGRVSSASTEAMSSAAAPSPERRSESALDSPSPHVSTLLEAVLAGDRDLVTTLLDRKANIQQVDKEGNTPLHLAVAKSKDMTALLLHRGAKTSKLNHDNKTPCDIAKEGQKEEILALFKTLSRFQFIPNKILLSPEYGCDIRKFRSPLDGEIKVMLMDKYSSVIKVYEKSNGGPKLPQGAFKTCREVLANGKSDSIRLSVGPKSSTPNAYEQLLRRLPNLLSAHQKLSDVPGIAHFDLIFSSVSESGEKMLDFYQEKYDDDLFSFIEHTNCTLAMKISLIKDMLRTLQIMHKREISHGDIKAENVLIKQLSNGSYKALFTDLDSCAFPQTVSPFRGSLVNISPELVDYLLKNKPLPFEYRKSGDIWALGITLYALLFKGETPPYLVIHGAEKTDEAEKAGEYFAHLHSLLTLNITPQKHVPIPRGREAPTSLCILLEKMLVIHPKHRASIDTLVQIFDRFEQTWNPSAVPAEAEFKR